jgi:hypothetical protein
MAPPSDEPDIREAFAEVGLAIIRAPLELLTALNRCNILRKMEIVATEAEKAHQVSIYIAIIL